MSPETGTDPKKGQEAMRNGVGMILPESGWMVPASAHRAASTSSISIGGVAIDVDWWGSSTGAGATGGARCLCRNRDAIFPSHGAIPADRCCEELPILSLN